MLYIITNMIIFAVFCVLFNSVIANSNDVLEYTKEDFLENIERKQNFVMYFAPWCSHCERFSPIWEELAKDLNSIENINIAIAKVDCTKQTELCSDQDITGYPTLKIYKIGQEEGKKFKGTRDIVTLKRFILEELIGSNALDVESEELKELDDKTFEEHVLVGNHFIKFYVPWCVHCQLLAPTWNKLANQLADNSYISISKIDCSQNKQICSNFEVVSYPTLMWLQDGKMVHIYRGPHGLSDLVDFVTQKLQPNDTEHSVTDDVLDVVDMDKAVVALSGGNFHFHISNGFTFVKFFAPWCGHCKRLAPTWQQLAQTLSGDRTIEIANVDCTLDENKELCNDQEVAGYPTLYFYHNGVKVSEYSGGRDLQQLLDYVKSNRIHDEL